MKKSLILLLCAAALLCVLSACGSSGGSDVTFESYKAWLAEAFVDRSPDPDGIRATLDALESWDDIDLDSQPWDMFFSESGYNASTWDEYVAAGGIGTFNEDVEVPSTEGGTPSGEPSGEPSAEPAA